MPEDNNVCPPPCSLCFLGANGPKTAPKVFNEVRAQSIICARLIGPCGSLVAFKETP